MVYLELEKMPKSCGECGLCMNVNNLCAYCMATCHKIKYTELDMRDGMCPLRDSDGVQIPGAKWMQVGTDIYKCSNCNAILYGATVETLVNTEHFCYSCGFKMEVDNDEN